jgi:5-methylcytosine-specific restriction endonuclease McrA
MAEDIISRKEARAQGLKYFFTGQPCIHGHIVKRFVSSRNCAECLRLYKRKRRQNSELRAQEREKERQCRILNPEQFRKRERKWRSAPRSKAIKARIQRNRRARKRLAGGEHTHEDIAEILIKQKYKCAYCRKSLRKKYQVDHIVPLARGGTNRRNNIQLTCEKCNHSKYAKDPLLFAQMLGRLL